MPSRAKLTCRMPCNNSNSKLVVMLGIQKGSRAAAFSYCKCAPKAPTRLLLSFSSPGVTPNVPAKEVG